MKIEHTESIDAPIGRVWAHTLDVESWPKVSPATMTRVRRLQDGPLHPGNTVRIKQPGQRSKTWTVSQVEAPSRFAWSARAFGTRVTAHHVLESNANGTDNTLIIVVEGILAPLVGRMIRRPISKALALENQGFKQAAEAGDV